MKTELPAETRQDGEHACGGAGQRSSEELQPVVHAPDGSGPLLQRDYVMVVEGARCGPAEVMQRMRASFERFSAPEWAEFDRPAGDGEPLDVGDTLRVEIAGAGPCGVRITHVDEHSLTMRTLDGHPESGRISLGAYHDDLGRLVLRIRSRARASDLLHYVGWETIGKHIQSQVWIHFLERLAADCGGRVLGSVGMETEEVPEEPADRGEIEAPTFHPPQPCDHR